LVFGLGWFLGWFLVIVVGVEDLIQHNTGNLRSEYVEKLWEKIWALGFEANGFGLYQCLVCS
jgi:hypothetical protein